MSTTTSIEWTDKTWGPVVGCTRVSPGCEHCYAESMASRNVLMADGLIAKRGFGERSVYLPVVDAERRRWSRKIALLPERLAEPLSFRAGTRVFVCSMSDLFHADVPYEFVEQVWAVMAAAPSVTFQVLTKRPKRMAEFLRWLAQRELGINVGTHALPPIEATLAGLGVDALPNVWLGTSVEDQQRANERIPHLLAAPAAVRFLSVEPLLGPVDLGEWIEQIDHCGSCGEENAPQAEDECPICGDTSCLITTWGAAQAERYRTGKRYTTTEGRADVDGVTPMLSWVIVGGESGPMARPMSEVLAAPLDPLPGGDLVRSLRDQCVEAGVAFFFKQWGGVNKKKAGRVLDGRTHDEMPEVARG